MRVAMYYNNNDIRIEELPVPKISDGELLIKVLASGICGSDVMEWYRIKKAPLVLGHEIAGVVEQAGAGAPYREGERVSASHHVPCNKCYYCQRGHHTACDTLRQTNFDPGGFAEYLRLPQINVDRGVYPIPNSVSFEEATFTEPLACVYRAQRIAGIQPGDSVLIIGSGIAGLLHLQLAKATGATTVVTTDIVEYRLTVAKTLGADAVFNANEDIPKKFRAVNSNRLADVVIVSTGAVNAIKQSLECVERGGTVLFFAPTEPNVTVPISINNLFFRNDITLTTSYAGSPADHICALKLIESKRVDVKSLITHRLSLAETKLGFQLVAAAKNSIKVIIEPQR